MSKVTIFFDYSCPFCYRAHLELKKLLPDFPRLEIEWMPTEAHPRPEGGIHTDLMMQGFLYAESIGADLMKYNDAMYDACQVKHVHFDDVEEIAKAAGKHINPEDLKQAITGGGFSEAQMKINDFAYEENSVWVLPAFRSGERLENKLDAIGGVGVSAEEIKSFFEHAAEGDK